MSESLSSKYLALPTYADKAKPMTFEWKRIQGRKEKLLSETGKEIMIEADKLYCKLFLFTS